jgi:hypothetical protein
MVLEEGAEKRGQGVKRTQKPTRRTRQRCRWWDEVSEYCCQPQTCPNGGNCIMHVSIICQGPHGDCGWEEKKRKTHRTTRRYRSRKQCRWWTEEYCELSVGPCDGVFDGCGWEAKGPR